MVVPVIDNLESIDPDVNLLDSVNGSDFSNNSCSYFTLPGYQSFSKNTQTFNFSLFNFNIRSFHANYSHLESVLDVLSVKFDFIVLTETWNSPSTIDLCQINSYSSFHTFRTSSRGGGVSIFYNQSFIASKIDSLCVCNEFVEACAV